MHRSLLLAVVVALAVPSVASAKRIHGTVVHHVPGAHSFVVATHAGHLRAVHSSHAPSMGRVVSVRARRLANGTFSARAVHLTRRHRRHVRLRGTVSHVNRGSGSFVLSARGTSVLIHDRDGRGKTSDLDQGEKAVVDATITDDDELEADDAHAIGPDGRFEVEGIVKAIDTAARTLTISADDDDESGETLVVTFPDGLDIPTVKVGDEIELVVTRSAEGALTAVSGGRDDDEGDDDDHDVGDDHGDDDDHEDGDNSGPSENSGSDD